MALARVVIFEGVSKDRMDEMDREMREGEPPEGLPASELVVLHDPEAEKSLVIVFFETEDDYKRGDEVLNAMPGSDTHLTKSLCPSSVSTSARRASRLSRSTRTARLSRVRRRAIRSRRRSRGGPNRIPRIGGVRRSAPSGRSGVRRRRSALWPRQDVSTSTGSSRLTSHSKRSTRRSARAARTRPC